MELTARKAVELSIELWTWLAESGEDKEDWPEWEFNGGRYAEVHNDCSLCEYDEPEDCEACPYHAKYGSCCVCPGPYGEWVWANTQEDRKKYAKKFLKQLKKILKDMEGE